MPENESTSSASDAFTFPQKSAAPKVGALPNHHKQRKNWAGDKDLCRKVWSTIKLHFDRFDGQTERDRFESRLNTADLMYRVSQRKPEDQENDKHTMSNVADTGYNRRIRTVTAGEQSVFFSTDELPAKFFPEPDTDDFSPEEGEEIADQQNLLEEYTFTKDNRKNKIKRVIWLTNKYADQIVSMQWDRRVELRRSRRPARDGDGRILRNEDGSIKRFENKEREVIIADNPTLIHHRIENTWFDATIFDLDDQYCIIEKDDPTLGDLWTLQQTGLIMNVGDIGRAALKQGDDESDVLDERKQNAEEIGETSEENGLITVWHAWVRLPINEKTGKWDAKNELPVWWWATFAGKMHEGQPVCLRLMRNPYNHGNQPYRLLYSHDDDKGAYHDGFPTLSEDLYWNITTVLNQALNNNTLRNRKPFIQKGRVLTRDLTFHANKVIKLDRTASLEEINIEDTTARTMEMWTRLDEIWDRTMNTDKPITGSPLGSRTSATEAKNIFDQAQKPAIEKADLFAQNLFPWMLKMDKALWEQFADPRRVVKLTKNNIKHEIKPADLWGPMTVKVTSVLQFENNSLLRLELNSFVNSQYFQVALQDMSPEGRNRFHRFMWDVFKIPDGETTFNLGASGDAARVAQQENAQMVGELVEVEVLPNEFFDEHIRWHKATLDELSALNDTDAEFVGGSENRDRAIEIIENHIRLTEAAKAESQQQIAGAVQQGAEGGGQATDLTGLAIGGQIGAAEGAQVA